MDKRVTGGAVCRRLKCLVRLCFESFFGGKAILSTRWTRSKFPSVIPSEQISILLRKSVSSRAAPHLYRCKACNKEAYDRTAADPVHYKSKIGGAFVCVYCALAYSTFKKLDGHILEIHAC